MREKIAEEMPGVSLHTFRGDSILRGNGCADRVRRRALLQAFPDLRADRVEPVIGAVLKVQQDGFIADPTFNGMAGRGEYAVKDVGHGRLWRCFLGLGRKGTEGSMLLRFGESQYYTWGHLL